MSNNGRESLYSELKTAIANREPVSEVTILRGAHIGSKLLVFADRVSGSLGNANLDGVASDIARELLADERSETREVDAGGVTSEVFFESFPPPPMLLIFGAVHVAQALARFATFLGFRIVVVDVRKQLATVERFPEADEIIHAWPDEALEYMEVGPTAAIAILSHDPKFDEPALLGSLETPARYIGAVGSRKTAVDRRERLRAAGVSDESIDRIHGPIGLDIGASDPDEMAISILGEIIAVRHGREGGPLASASGNIRARV